MTTLHYGTRQLYNFLVSTNVDHLKDLLWAKILSIPMLVASLNPCVVAKSMLRKINSNHVDVVA